MIIYLFWVCSARASPALIWIPGAWKWFCESECRLSSRDKIKLPRTSLHPKLESSSDVVQGFRIYWCGEISSQCLFVLYLTHLFFCHAMPRAQQGRIFNFFDSFFYIKYVWVIKNTVILLRCPFLMSLVCSLGAKKHGKAWYLWTKSLSACYVNYWYFIKYIKCILISSHA